MYHNHRLKNPLLKTFFKDSLYLCLLMSHQLWSRLLQCLKKKDLLQSCILVIAGRMISKQKPLHFYRENISVLGTKLKLKKQRELCFLLQCSESVQCFLLNFFLMAQLDYSGASLNYWSKNSIENIDLISQ